MCVGGGGGRPWTLGRWGRQEDICCQWLLRAPSCRRGNVGPAAAGPVPGPGPPGSPTWGHGLEGAGSRGVPAGPEEEVPGTGPPGAGSPGGELKPRVPSQDKLWSVRQGVGTGAGAPVADHGEGRARALVSGVRGPLSGCTGPSRSAGPSAGRWVPSGGPFLLPHMSSLAIGA